MPSMQTRRKRKVGQTLARLRERSGHTIEQVAALLRRSAGQVSKYENGYNLCAFAELSTMLVLYNATAEERAEVESLWEDAKQDSTRIAFSSAVPPKFRAFLRTEADATTISEVQPCCVPGLLQTAEYAAAIQQSSYRIVDTSVEQDRLVNARLARQRLLEGDQPLRLHAVLDVAVIKRRVGGPSVMADQLRHLLAAGQRDNIEIQVIDYGAGAYGTMSGPVTIFGFEDEDPNTVYLEYPGGGEWVDDAADTAKFVAMFQDVSALALSGAESAALIRAQAEAMEEL
ncbi:helix-turn-helix domain-containing protein [Actinokineospora fastidiosa]|uniref:Transcriptional regulator n=1 Tax=Actinokineospora fastidiosa TaxID=1816 RepID=A0A918G7V9_9PSEU|nr:helix-turn-helix transcriptional regulator [Actinokineospora fastidiosa]GGS20138.1 transcriptional regulator [Actinokineospora fastidiosa]